MLEILTIIVLGFGLVVLIALRFATRWFAWDQATHLYTPLPARPRGVQETDLPPFRFRDPAAGAGWTAPGPVEDGAYEAKAA